MMMNIMNYLSKLQLLFQRQGYKFSIYSRTGEEIFTTNDPSKGWDGKYQGSNVQIGNYVYHVEYINGLGELSLKRQIWSPLIR